MSTLADGRREDLRGRGFGELVKDLSSELSTLARQEVELAKAEATEKGKKAGAAQACSAAPPWPGS